jgi:Uma2 family endonuclease
MLETLLDETTRRMNWVEFLDNYPENQGRFELYNGEIIAVEPTGTHGQVAGFLTIELGIIIRNLGLPYFIPKEGIIKPIDSEYYGFNPDVMILDRNQIELEPMWKKRSTITQGKSCRLVIEVTSTNWRDDYVIKADAYEKLGIAEYWIVDYLGLGGRRFIGYPKQPIISIYQLVEDEYIVKQFRGQEKIESLEFSHLNLTAAEIFAVGQ